jgi:pimeloyl-ACP methyl ester carboxylesterase
MPHLKLDGVNLFYTDHGGSGTPIVLVHAAAGTSACWVNQVPAFGAAGYRVVTFDLRNFGQSRAEPGQETAGSIAGDLLALVQDLGLPPFVLVGTAYGGFGALEFACDHPEHLLGLVLSTSFGGLSDPEYTALRSKHVRPDLASLPTVEKELGATYRSGNPQGVKRFLEMEHDSYRSDGARQPLGRPLTLQRVAQIKVPALVIAADEDVYAPPPVMQAIAEAIPGARFAVVNGAGHSAYWEQPDVWNAMVLDFARTLSG